MTAVEQVRRGGRLEHVWRGGRIGPLTLPHRIVMGSMHLGLEGLDDGGRALAEFYRERAEGGAALIVTGGSAVSRVGAGGRNYSFINEDAHAPALERAAAAVHDAGARILLQLFHAGRYAYEDAFGLQPVAPSPVYSRYSRCEPRALCEAELLATIEDFARGAARARELGFDGVELMGSEGYLLNQFMAPATNQREDDWGGDPKRRRRFPLAVAAAVREAWGAGGAVVYRISGADLVPGGAAENEVLELARRLSRDGAVDGLNVGIGWHEARIPTVQALVPHGAWRPWARAIREAVDVPVIASNRINTLAQADQALAAGDADFVSLARPFLADPAIVAKTREGARAVNVCIACNQACIDHSIFDRRVSCVVNPRAGYELDLPLRGGPDRSMLGARGARVAVVGGGPAGMEAARALATAGHRVELFEAGERLGGQFRMAWRIPGKEDFERTIEYFEAELARLGVSVRVGERVADRARLDDFDGVVVATGVLPRHIELPGADLPHVHTYAELLLDGTGVGDTVAIIGAGGIGVDVAHRLSYRAGADARAAFYAEFGLRAAGAAAPPPSARRVTMMRRGARVGEGIGPSTRWAVLDALARAGVEILTGVEYLAIEPGAVRIRHPAGGEEHRVPADTVVVAAGQRSEAWLAAELERADQPHVVIGGAALAAELDAERAFREGARAPGALASVLVGSRR
ncbi:MAG: FAD-dependent oxidoreductase [Solirubrobacterales bacterium]|nr:FAD-dependent oxidoreductase [Solirubrobacterales bacterium]MBV9715144.1 FAD-dependent oxidoreductase [Solirubrobacterales bacterium]